MKIRVAFALALLLCLGLATFAQQPPKTRRAAGRVMAVTPDSITVKPGAMTLALTVDSSTKVTGKGVGTKLRAMKAENRTPQITDLVDVNDSVVIEYHDLGEGKLHAVQIKIRVKAFNKRAVDA